jgi:tight adherence protein C
LVVAQVDTGTVPKSSVKKDLQRNVFASVHWIRGMMGMSADSKLLDRFAKAGLKSAAHRDAYFAGRMLGPVAAIGIASFITSNRYFWMIALAGISYLAPDIALQRLVKRRREKIRRSVPDAIDLLVICVDAGLGMDQAMLRVGQELGSSHPQLHEEFLQINREQRAGKPRLEAWQAMADRCQLPEMDAFANMLMQTERFGTPIARALSNFGDGIRQKRRQKAEEMAAKTTVKIIFPLVLFIFPSMFIVLLGPAGITIAHGLSGTAQ